MMLHSFDPEIAQKYGINEAILLNYIYQCVEYNRANRVHCVNGYYWVYNSVKAFTTQFPYMDSSAITAALKTLIDAGLIAQSNFNVAGYDRTTWYTLTQVGTNVVNHVSSADITGQTDIIIQDNPFADNDSPRVETVEMYLSSNLDLTTGNMDEFETEYKDKLPDELIRWAVDEGVARLGKTVTWCYVRAILNNMVKKGMQTVSEANAAKEARQRDKRGSNQQDERPNGDWRLLNAPFAR